MKTLQTMTGAAALAAMVAWTGAATAESPRFDTTLRVATFTGTWPEAIRSEVGEALADAGIQLEFVGGNSSEFLARLVAARGQPAPFDVVEVGDDTYPDFRRGDFLAKLNKENIPNLSLLAPSLHDDYIVSNWLSQPSLVYNADKFAEAGIPAPTRYSDLANPALRGRVLLPDITSYNAYYLITALAYENGGSEKDPAPGIEKIREIQPHSAVATSGAVSQLFNAGDVWAALWGAHVGQRIAASGINISIAHPEVKGSPVAIARGFLGVVADSPNQEAAEFYINAILSRGVQERFSTEYGMVPVTSDALETALENAALDKAGNPFLKLEADDVAKAWWPDYEVIDKRQWAREFQRALAN